MSLSTHKPIEPITDRQHRMTFGKYRGFTVGTLLDNKPSYLLWLCDKTDFELGSDLMDEAEDGVDRPDFD